MIKLIEMLELSDKSTMPKKFVNKWRKFIGKTVSFEYYGPDETGKPSKVHMTGTLTDFGVSQLATHFKSKYYTFTINRSPNRVFDLNKVNIESTHINR